MEASKKTIRYFYLSSLFLEIYFLLGMGGVIIGGLFTFLYPTSLSNSYAINLILISVGICAISIILFVIYFLKSKKAARNDAINFTYAAGNLGSQISKDEKSKNIGNFLTISLFLGEMHMNKKELKKAGFKIPTWIKISETLVFLIPVIILILGITFFNHKMDLRISERTLYADYITDRDNTMKTKFILEHDYLNIEKEETDHSISAKIGFNNKNKPIIAEYFNAGTQINIYINLDNNDTEKVISNLMKFIKTISTNEFDLETILSDKKNDLIDYVENIKKNNEEKENIEIILYNDRQVKRRIFVTKSETRFMIYINLNYQKEQEK